MGRRNVGLLVAALAAAVVLSASAVASRALTWREVSAGGSYEVQLVSPVAFVASSRAELGPLNRTLPPAALATISRVDFKRNVVVVVLAGWACMGHRYTVSSVSQRAKKLKLVLASKPMPRGTDCVTLVANYRALAVPRSQLRRPYPTVAEARFAGA